MIRPACLTLVHAKGDGVILQGDASDFNSLDEFVT